MLPMLIKQCEIGRRTGSGWPWLYGPRGCGKTVTAEQIADSLGIKYNAVNWNEEASSSWLWGGYNGKGEYIASALVTAYTKGELFLGDENDSISGNLGTGLNTLLSGSSVMNPITGELLKRHPNFVYVAAANTAGKGGTGAYSGRNRQDGALLDRFFIFKMDYDKKLEEKLCPDQFLRETLWKIRDRIEKEKSQDSISTRALVTAYTQLQMGFTVKEILTGLAHKYDRNISEFTLQLAKESASTQKEESNAVPF